MGQRGAGPEHGQDSLGDLIVHLPQETKITRDVRQLQPGQLLLQDGDRMLVGCKGRGRASPPPAGTRAASHCPGHL